MPTIFHRRRTFWVVIAGLLLCGCNRSMPASRAPTSDPVPSITAEDLFELGVFHAGRGDLIRAEQYLSAARERGYDPSTAVYWLVRVCVSAGRYHSALRHSASYLRGHPDSWGLRLVVASIYEALGDFHEAQLNLERIVASEPQYALAHYRLAMLYHRRTPLPERALPHLRAYLQLAPHGPHVAEARILVAELAGREAP